MNTVSIMGRVANDIELKKTSSGKSVTNVTVAVDRGWKDDKHTDFFEVVAWNGTAEFLSKYFTKGQMIAITGSLQTRQWEDKEGNKRKSTEILAGQVYFCGGKQNNTLKEELKGEYPQYETMDLLDDSDLPFD